MRTRQIIIIVSMLILLSGVSAFGDRAVARRAPTNPGTTNLVAWWALNETSGTRNDSHGSNHLTDNNTVGYTTGKKGNAANFIASNNEYLSIADNSAISAGDVDLCMGGWINISNVGATHWLVTKWDGGGTIEYLLWYWSGNGFRFEVHDGTNQGNVTASSFGVATANQWNYVVACHSASSNIITIQVNNGTINSAAWSTGIRDLSNGMRFVSPNGGAYFDGSMDEMMFYKKYLTTDERDWLYNSGTGREYCEVANNCATPTPTITPTFTATNTATLTHTPTITQTYTPTITPTNTSAITPTYTRTPTQTQTPTPTITHTFTPTPTHTATETLTPTETPTITPTFTITPTATITKTPTITPTPTITNTPGAWVSDISKGDVANVTAISLLCLVVILFGIGGLVINTMIRKRNK